MWVAAGALLRHRNQRDITQRTQSLFERLASESHLAEATMRRLPALSTRLEERSPAQSDDIDIAIEGIDDLSNPGWRWSDDLDDKAALAFDDINADLLHDQIARVFAAA